MSRRMSAIGTKRTSALRRTCPLLGVERTWLFAYDPKRTLRQFGPYLGRDLNLYDKS